MKIKDSKLIQEVREGGGGMAGVIIARIIRWIVDILSRYKKMKYNRSVSLGDLFIDRSEKAKFLGFGEGTTVYDNVLVLGDVKVGKNTWIGPNVILDGSGGLEIGNYCSISAGVHIYTHDTVRWALTGGSESYEHDRTVIGDNCYIGPNVVIQKGVAVGNGSIIGANSLVNSDIPAGSKAFGNPARVVGSAVDYMDKKDR